MRHMTSEEFRKAGYAAVDWVADYLDRVESMPVLSQVRPGDLRGALPAGPPTDGEPFEAILADLDRLVLPGITHWQHPSFFAYFPANGSGPAVLGDLLSSGLGVQGMLWATSPACTELEQHVVDWLAGLLGLPDRFLSTSERGGGVIQDSASSATLVAVLAARERATGGASNLGGVRQPLVVYTSTQAHSSVEKAVRIAGIGADNLRLVDVDPATQAMDPADLRRRVRADRAAGLLPTACVATIGTTSTSAIDPIAEVGAVSAEEGLWLHVDAAYAGVAAVCPELRWVNDGVAGFADSYATNPHKWLLTSFDCDAFWVADRAALTAALSVTPEYLRNAATESGQVADLRDWQVPLGRRFRALKLWSVLRWYGVSGLQEHIRAHVDAAQQFAAWVRADPRFELVAPHPLSLVCFRLRGGAGAGADAGDRAADEASEALLTSVNAGGRAYLTHTRVNGRYALRLAVGGTRTELRHVEQVWADLQALAG